MFDSVVQPQRPKGRLGVGAFVSVFMHVSAVAFAFWLTQHVPAARDKEVPVTFVRPAAPPPPPPPPAARSSRPKTKPKPHPIVQKQIIAPKEIPPEKPPETPPPEEPAEEEDEGVEGGVEGGVVGGVPGGVVGGVLGGQLGQGPVEFNEAMTPPRVLSGPNPEYTDQALEHEVEGLMVVKCIVSVEGAVRNCRILQSLPFMDRAVISALEHRRYSAALFQGKPIEVDYTFKIRLTLPR
jgi:protein TonB